MTFDPVRHHRRSIRLPGFDYSAGGTFFITICAEDRRCLFGAVIDGEMHLNDAGRVVDASWRALPSLHPSISTDVLQIMPNHLHGVLRLTACDHLSLADVIRRLKTFTTTRYINGVRRHGWARFRGRLWQRDYFEHVVRNDRELESIRDYVAGNPSHWGTDPDNPAAARGG